jgi:hypothetical protein
MELKSVQDAKLISIKITQPLKEAPVSFSSSNTLGTTTNRASEVQIRSRHLESERYLSQNSTINIANVATQGIQEASNLIEGVVASLATEGKVELGSVSATLEKIAASETPEGTQPLSGEAFSLPIGDPPPTLRFPGDIRAAFGLNTTPPPSEYDLSLLQERLKAFRDQSDAVLKTIYNAAANDDVALQNSKAATTQVDAVDSALDLAKTAGKLIANKPQEAIASNSQFSSYLLRLVQT